MMVNIYALEETATCIASESKMQVIIKPCSIPQAKSKSDVKYESNSNQNINFFLLLISQCRPPF